MSLKKYSVLKGRPISIRFGTSSSPHYQIHVVAGEEDYRIAVNVQSGDGSGVEFLIRSRVDHPITAELAQLDPVYTSCRRGPGVQGSTIFEAICFNRRK